MKALLRWRRALADRSLRGRPHGATLVAIARDEGPYLLEWLAYHLAIGFDRVVVYDNESSDDTRALFRRIVARDLRVRRVAWPTPTDTSPQILAYYHALTNVVTPWVMYLDIDEFLVPSGHAGISDLIRTLPDDVSSLHVNWRCFGSSGLAGPGYGHVTRAFTRCARPDWKNQAHFKTLVRADRITKVLIHDVRTSHGRRVLSDGRDLVNVNDGQSDRIVYDGVQVNHYQCKTFPEFEARKRRGSANFPVDHPGRLRDASLARFRVLDRNEAEDVAIRRFDAAFEAEFRRLSALVGQGPALSG